MLFRSRSALFAFQPPVTIFSELAARVLTPSWGTQVGVLLGNGEYATMLVPLLAIALTILGLGIVARASRRTRLEQRLERHCQ
mgnify:CR=1 FL=1